MRIAAVFIMGLLALSGCKSEDEAVDDGGADLCGAAPLQPLVGTPFSEASFAADARIIRPDTAVTMDFQVERLNVELDENDIITRIACG